MPSFEFRTGRVSFRNAGAGTVVIAVHGSSSHSGQWGPLLAALEDRAHVVAPDLLGYGLSSAFAQDGRAWWDHDVALLNALIEHLGGTSVHLVGHSLGAALLVYLARASNRIDSLCLYEPVLFPLLEEAGAPEAAEGWHISSELHGLIRLGREAKAAERFVDFWSGTGAWGMTPETAREYVIATIGRLADDWAGAVSVLDGQIRLAELEQITVPTLLLSGDRSRPSIRRIAELVVDRMPNSELAVLDGMTHMAPVTNPDKVLPHMVSWLDRHMNH